MSKDGQAPQYKFAMAADILRAVRGPLVDAGLSITFEYDGHDEPMELITAKKSKWYCYIVYVNITLTDTTTGYCEMCKVAAQGTDPADKSFSKAYTAALKTFLINTFLIPTGDDPEHDNPEGTTQPRQHGQQKPEYAKPGEAFKKPGEQAAEPPEESEPEPEPENNRVDHTDSESEFPPYTNDNTIAIMKGLETYYRGEETGNFKFNPDILKRNIIEKFKRWPTTKLGSDKVKAAWALVDVADEVTE